jgi:hypothetical protein
MGASRCLVQGAASPRLFSATRKGNVAENYVTCRCQYCNGGIEFDASGFLKGEKQLTPCPHCQMETAVYIPSASTVQKSGATKPRKIIKVAVILFCTLLILDDISKRWHIYKLQNSLALKDELELLMRRAEAEDLALMAETSIVETKAYDRDSAAGFYDLLTIRQRQQTLKLNIQTEFNRGRKDADRFYFTELQP